MKLIYNGIIKENLVSGIDLNISDIQRNIDINNIFNKTSSEMLDFLDLPQMEINAIEKIQKAGTYIFKNFKNFVVLGIGGSALGIKFLQDAFVNSAMKDIGINVYVCDNIDSDNFIPLINKLKLEDTFFNVITKSGTTSETLAQMMIVINRYKRANIDFAKHFIITTTRDNKLHNFAQNNNIETFDIPKGVGGRFSVLSPVGLLPASVMGINISQLLEGAKNARERAMENSLNNIAYTCANIVHIFLKKGMTNFVVMPYSERLRLFPDFFAQLWAESLGKKLNKKGYEVFTGQTPIKAVGVTDQHSQLQLYSEGIKDKIIMFLTVEKNEMDELIENDFGMGEHLKGASLKSLMDYEYQSTAYSLTQNDRPNFTISIDCITEKTIGELIFMVELMTAYMGEMMQIDAFNQPGVELSKIYTKACLKHAGFEDKEKEILDFIGRSKKFTID